MDSLRKTLVFPLVGLLFAATSAYAGQQHVVTPSELAATVTDGVAKQDANRAAVHEALARPEVQAVASKLGLDLTRGDKAVDVLSGSELEKAANAAQQVNDQLVGGASTVVISTTTIVIILLLVIILIIAVK